MAENRSSAGTTRRGRLGLRRGCGDRRSSRLHGRCGGCGNGSRGRRDGSGGLPVGEHDPHLDRCRLRCGCGCGRRCRRPRRLGHGGREHHRGADAQCAGNEPTTQGRMAAATAGRSRRRVVAGGVDIGRDRHRVGSGTSGSTRSPGGQGGQPSLSIDISHRAHRRHAHRWRRGSARVGRRRPCLAWPVRSAHSRRERSW
jgi:hypothetical protein